MLKRQFLSTFLFSFLFSVSLHAQNGIITTIAGSGSAGFSGDGGQALLAEFNRPSGIAVDTLGNIYISDRDNNRVRKIDVNGVVTTIAGTGNAGSSGDGGPAISAELNKPKGIVLDAQGNIYVAEFAGHRVRKIDVNGNISTYAGTGISGYNNDNIQANTAMLKEPRNLALDAAGNLYIGEYTGYRIRKVSPAGIITTVVGTGYSGSITDGTPAISSPIDLVSGIAIDDTGNIYFSGQYSSRFYKVNTAGNVYKIAGLWQMWSNGDGGPALQAGLDNPADVLADTSGVYLIDQGDFRIRKINGQGIINGFAGNGNQGFSGDGGAAINAMMEPAGFAKDRWGRMYIADGGNNRIRMIDTAQAPVSIQAIAADAEEILVYPNPARSGVVEINIPGNIKAHTELIVMNVAGQEIKSIPVESGGRQKMELNIAAGSYFLVIKSKERNWLGKLTITE
jgi:sugar lactone lactonase YvrE